MKKILSVLLITALVTALLSGCTPSSSADTIPSPTPLVEKGKKLQPVYSTEKNENGEWDDVITYNVFNTEDYQTRWTKSAKEWMLERFHIKIGYTISAITGFDDTWSICLNKTMEDPANRDLYKSKFVALFIAEKTRPDYMPSIYGSCLGTDGAWFAVSEYLVDLLPYVEKGGSLYDSYVGWLWDGKQDYWETSKQLLMDDAGHLFVIPRREMMPVQSFLGYSPYAFEQIGLDWDEKPSDWDDFVEMLKKYMAFHSMDSASQYTPTALRTTDENGADLIQFVATTYGLDFNADFSWTTKNGEPLWTYYWDEYLSILKNVNELAAEGLVFTHEEYPNRILNYTLDKTEPFYKSIASMESGAGSFSGIACYCRDDRMAWWNSSDFGRNKWEASDTWVSQDGYDFSLVGGTSFDCNYLAIGNRLGDEFTARIMDFWNFSLNDEGYNYYQFGQYGFPFAKTVEEAGSYIFDEDGKVVYTNHLNRFTREKDKATPDHYWWSKRDADWWTSKSPYYEAYIAGTFNGWGIEEGDGDTVAEALGFTDIKVFESVDTFKKGTWFYGDVTAYPMSRTAYWPDESMSKSEDAIKIVEKAAEVSNSYCYKGFFASTKEVLGKESGEMDLKIHELEAIAKNFTTGFLSYEKTESDWTNYIKSLQDAGYEDVYNYYCDALIWSPVSKRSDVLSQSATNEAQKNK